MTIRSTPVSSDNRGAALVEELQQFERDSQFLALHRHTLLDSFPEQWVAVFNKKVVAHGTNINTVRRDLTRKKIPQNRVALSFLTRQKKTLIL
jgi:hypothetical protein